MQYGTAIQRPWNAPFYASCDLIMGISKQSHNLHRIVLERTYKDSIEVIDIGKDRK